ncbi:MAG: Appr-1-p processing protein [Fibrobacteres bacterium]|nr:Appr-1-p processing protein [Fibrobacterota bacterium]
MLRFLSGDLLQTQAEYIAQGVAEGNQEGLGTGLAFKISSRWPEVQSAFKKYARSGTFRGGDIWVFPKTDGIKYGFVYLATQPDMYHATLPYLRKSIRKLAKWCAEESIPSVGLPKIGSGLGKLSWEAEVKPLLLETLSDHPTHFHIYQDFTNADEAST